MLTSGKPHVEGLHSFLTHLQSEAIHVHNIVYVETQGM